jgi:hypothetical protein
MAGRFTRRQATLTYRKVFLVATEGTKTEPSYFQMLNSEIATVKIKCFFGTNNSPPQLVTRLLRCLASQNLQRGDEAWVVFDKDSWTPGQINSVLEASAKQGTFAVALSNPKFELWLLLHFQDGAGIRTSTECDDALNQHIKDYDKTIRSTRFSQEVIRKAIYRAKKMHEDDVENCPGHPCTTVYKLVEKILGKTLV